MTFGQKIALVRKQHGLTQSAVGSRAGISGDIVGKYERDEMKPSIDTAKKLADALEVSLDYLLGDQQEQVIDQKMLRRLQEIEHLPSEVREKVLFFVDMAIRDFKARQAFRDFEPLAE